MCSHSGNHLTSHFYLKKIFIPRKALKKSSLCKDKKCNENFITLVAVREKTILRIETINLMIISVRCRCYIENAHKMIRKKIEKYAKILIYIAKAYEYINYMNRKYSTVKHVVRMNAINFTFYVLFY